MVESYYQRIAKIQKANEDAEIKKETLRKKVRDIYGFDLHSNDPRFAKVVADEKLAKKKEAKDAKKSIKKP